MELPVGMIIDQIQSQIQSKSVMYSRSKPWTISSDSESIPPFNLSGTSSWDCALITGHRIWRIRESYCICCPICTGDICGTASWKQNDWYICRYEWEGVRRSSTLACISSLAAMWAWPQASYDKFLLKPPCPYNEPKVRNLLNLLFSKSNVPCHLLRWERRFWTGVGKSLVEGACFTRKRIAGERRKRQYIITSNSANAPLRNPGEWISAWRCQLVSTVSSRSRALDLTKISVLLLCTLLVPLLPELDVLLVGEAGMGSIDEKGSVQF